MIETMKINTETMLDRKRAVVDRNTEKTPGYVFMYHWQNGGGNHDKVQWLPRNP